MVVWIEILLLLLFLEVNNYLKYYLDELSEEECAKWGFNSFIQKHISKVKFAALINKYK